MCIHSDPTNDKTQFFYVLCHHSTQILHSMYSFPLSDSEPANVTIIGAAYVYLTLFYKILLVSNYCY